MHTLPTEKAEKYVHKCGKDYFLLILNRHIALVWETVQFQYVIYILLMVNKNLLLLSTKGHFHHNNSLNIIYLYIILLKSTQVLLWHYFVIFFFLLGKSCRLLTFSSKVNTIKATYRLPYNKYVSTQLNFPLNYCPRDHLRSQQLQVWVSFNGKVNQK